MTEHVTKVTELVLLLQNNPRITIRRVQREIGLSRRTTYRYVNEVVPKLSMRIERGVIIKDDDPEDQKTMPKSHPNTPE